MKFNWKKSIRSLLSLFLILASVIPCVAAEKATSVALEMNEKQNLITEIAVTKTNDSVQGWPAEVKEVKYLSDADNSMQPTLYYAPETDKPVPLLVGLHTWSNNYKQPEPAYAKWCIAKGWAFVHPNFRGANNKPEACGSELVVKDILSAVEYAKKNSNIDPNRIYLVGVSGGGYAAMLLAGRSPQTWAAVSAWCGIYDLKDWYNESRERKANYADMIAKSCGGALGASAEVDEQYRLRSASNWLSNAKGIPLDINTGIHDGHKGSVPTSHSLNAFNVLAATADKISKTDIDTITEKSEILAALKLETNDPLYSTRKALMRKTSGNARVTVFDGGHEIIFDAALRWLEQQQKGKAPVWKITQESTVNLNDITTQSGK